MQLKNSHIKIFFEGFYNKLEQQLNNICTYQFQHVARLRFLDNDVLPRTVQVFIPHPVHLAQQ